MATALASVSNPPRDRPLMVYDGECGFCRYWLVRWRRRIGGRVDYEPFQRAAARFPDVPLERFRRAVQLIDTDGAVYQGAEAVFRALALVPGYGGWLRLYRGLPGARPAFEGAYRFVADHRPAFDRLTRLLLGPDPARVSPGARLALGAGLVLVVALVFRSRRSRR